MKEELKKAAPALVGWLAMAWVSPLAALAALAVAAGLWLVVRSLSLSICLAALSFPLGAFLIEHPSLPRLAIGLVLGAALAWYYREGLRTEA